MSEKKKRERGANYTPEDKALLSDIILKYKHIIENKRTGGIFLQKKKDAWAAVTIKYNSNCSTGSRTTDQLKALYDNMKQKTKKDVGELNKQNYIIYKSPNVVSNEDLQKALKNVKNDKVSDCNYISLLVMIRMFSHNESSCDAMLVNVMQLVPI